MNIASAVMGTKPATTEANEAVEEEASKVRMTPEDHRRAHLTGLHGSRRISQGRVLRRLQKAADANQAKKATRKYRRDLIAGLQDQQTALGLAQVYLGGAGNPAMQRNVSRHVDSMAEMLARRDRPEVFADDTLEAGQQIKAELAAIEEARGLITDRLREVLDAHA